jgi:hypothetical protein
LGKRLATPHHKKKKASYEMLHRALEVDGFLEPRQWKMDMGFGTWNVRSPYGSGSDIIMNLRET